MSASVGRWAALVAMLAASGWAGFTLYERMRVDAAVPNAEAADASPESALVAEAFRALAADALDEASQKLEEAGGGASTDVQVQEGLVLVAARRCERSYLALTLAQHDDSRRHALVEQLDEEVHRAREAIAQARRLLRAGPILDRIEVVERSIHTMLVMAFVHAGELDRARGALSARLADHPQRELLKAYVGAAPAPAASASASASASAAPPSAPASAATIRPPGPAMPYQPHYELPDEPHMGEHPKTPGELEIPVPAPQD